jgi:rhamnosyltransferase
LFHSLTGQCTVSVIIPAKNEAANIGACLDAVCRQETPFPLEIIVIDSGSSDGTTGIVRRYPAIKLVEIQPEAFGHGKTRNLGAEMSGGTFIVFLNADAVPKDNRWLTHLIDPFITDKNKEVAGVFSRHIPGDGCHLYMVRDIRASMPAAPEPIVRSRTGALDFMIFSTVSCALRREVWLKYPFEPNIPIAEDQKWARLMLEKGFKIVYQPASMVYHSHNYTPHQLYEIKFKVAGAAGKFKNRLSAMVVGFVLITGGIITKIAGDLGFILFKYPEKIPLSRKLKEILIAFKARTAGFLGTYRGWLEKKKT